MANVIGAIREFIKGCPHLEEFHKGIGVDYLAEDDTAYMIESVPGKPILRRYINGDTDRQFLFAFSTQEAYGSDVKQNLENIGFFDNFSAWLEQCTDEGNLPTLGENQTAKKIEVTSTGYAYNTGVDKAQYRIQCRLIYLQRK